MFVEVMDRINTTVTEWQEEEEDGELRIVWKGVGKQRTVDKTGTKVY